MYVTGSAAKPKVDVAVKQAIIRIINEISQTPSDYWICNYNTANMLYCNVFQTVTQQRRNVMDTLQRKRTLTRPEKS